MTEYAYDEGTAEVAGVSSVMSAADAERLIARNAVISLVVDNVEEAAAGARAAVAKLDGTVMQESLDLTAGEVGHGRVVIEVVVPPENLDQALDQIASLGQVKERRIESLDVTDEVVDVETRIETMRESIKRLQGLMDQSGSVADIAAVEAELTVRQAELESLLARQQSLEKSVVTSPIVIEMSTEVDALEYRPAGFLGGLKGGWKALVAAGGVALTAFGALIPWLVVAAIIAVPTVMIRRRWRQTHSPRPRPAPMPRMVPVPMAMHPASPPMGPPSAPVAPPQPGVPGTQPPGTPVAPPQPGVPGTQPPGAPVAPLQPGVPGAQPPGAPGAPPGPPPSAPPTAQPPPTQNPPTLPPT